MRGMREEDSFYFCIFIFSTNHTKKEATEVVEVLQQHTERKQEQVKSNLMQRGTSKQLTPIFFYGGNKPVLVEGCEWGERGKKYERERESSQPRYVH